MNARLAALNTLIRRYPYCAVCSVLIVIFAATAWFFAGQNEEFEVSRQDRAKEGEAMLTLLVGGSTQRQELAAVREAARRIEENLVIESNLPENAFYFYKFEEQSKAHLAELHPVSSPATDSSELFRRVPYTLRVTGTYEQVLNFLSAIESGPRLANITAFAFSRREATGSGGVSLDLSLELLGKK
jgi:Tfp pilus assembly protein PilO